MSSVNINNFVVYIAKFGSDKTEGRCLHSIFISGKPKIYFIMLDSSIQPSKINFFIVFTNMAIEMIII